MSNTEVREAACLAHSIPGVTLRLVCQGGEEVLVSYACLGADLDPCQLRAALMAELAHPARGSGRLARAVMRIEIVAGLCALGAGLYRRSGGPDGSDERWFVTSLPPGSIPALLDDCPVASVAQFDVVVRPDPDLGLCAVGVSGPAADLDEAAVWALGRIAVAELLRSL